MKLYVLLIFWFGVMAEGRFGYDCPKLHSAEEKEVILGLFYRTICYTSDFLLFNRNLINGKCEANDYCNGKCYSYAWKDPLNGCQIYEGLTKTESQTVSNDIEKIYPGIASLETVVST